MTETGSQFAAGVVAAVTRQVARDSPMTQAEAPAGDGRLQVMVLYGRPSGMRLQGSASR